jgi:hypothetical protein
MKPTNKKLTPTVNAVLKDLTVELRSTKSGPDEEHWVEPSEPASQMAQSSVDSVSLIAAHLSRPDLSAHECVIKAYEIIHWASVGHGYLIGNPHPRINRWTALVTDYIRREQSGEMRQEDESALSYVEWDENKKPKPLTFLTSLKAIDPKGKNNKQRKLRIEKWLIALVGDSQKEAKSKLLSWERHDAMPFAEFDFAFYSFRLWMRGKTSAERSKVKTDALAKEKKAPQKKTTRRARGRVKRKTDGRLGARAK